MRGYQIRKFQYFSHKNLVSTLIVANIFFTTKILCRMRHKNLQDHGILATKYP